MNLWFSTHLLVAGLFLSASALTPEECEPLIKPLSLADPSVLYGTVTFITGYTDNEDYATSLRVVESSFTKITPSPSDSKEFSMHQETRSNGTCFSLVENATIHGDTAVTTTGNITTTFHMLPTCDGCLLFSGKTTSNREDHSKILQLLGLNSTIEEEEIRSHGLYLMAKESTVKDSDLEHFKQQASCLGFTGEPDFHYDPKKSFCHEDEAKVKISLH